MWHDGPVKDEDILTGFASLHQAVATGFEGVQRQFNGVQRQFDGVRQQFLDVRNDIARLEQRMLRRFDEVDAKLEDHEVRITALEARS